MTYVQNVHQYIAIFALVMQYAIEALFQVFMVMVMVMWSQHLVKVRERLNIQKVNSDLKHEETFLLHQHLTETTIFFITLTTVL